MQRVLLFIFLMAFLHLQAEPYQSEMKHKRKPHKEKPQNPYKNYHIGKGTYGSPKIIDYAPGLYTLSIGNYCYISFGVTFLLNENHSTSWISTYPFLLWPEGAGISPPPQKGHTIVGNDVYIGHNALILSGVTIGDGAIIGAGSVVTKDVPPYTIVGGVPARAISKRIPEGLIPKLLQIAWWDWPESKIAAALPYLLSDDIARFIQFAESTN